MTVVKVTENDMAQAVSAAEELREYYAALSSRRGSAARYIVKTYGCQLNEADSEKLIGMLESFGLTKAGEGQKADVVLLNTCAIRENAEDRLFGNLGEFKADRRADKDMVLAVCGCMMKVPKNVEKIRKSFPYTDLVFDPQQIHLFAVLLRDAIKSRKQLVNIGSIDYIADDSLIPISRQRKFRALVPIMYGCNNFCTYCVVPFTRGRERSRDFGSVISELQSLAQQGYKEVMLLGQNVNSYNGGASFTDLLRAASEIKGFSRIRFMSSHPKDISDEVIDIMASCDNIEKHLHLPLQSGSDRILKLMNRPYDTERFMHTVDLFRSKVPDGAISTDIIVGFPGETEEDFEQTLKAVERAKFDSAFTFQYSPRPGSKAADMEDQIPADIVTERFGRLLKLQNDLTFESNKALVGKTLEVLIEGESSTAPDILTGRTKSNHLINFTIPEELRLPGKKASDYEGLLCEVKFTNARPYSVDGIMERLLT